MWNLEAATNQDDVMDEARQGRVERTTAGGVRSIQTLPTQSID